MRIAAWFIPLAAVGSAVIWALGYKYKLPFLSQRGAVLTPSFFILELLFFVSLPFSGVVHIAAGIYEKIRRKKIKGTDFSGDRRRFIKTASAVFPLVAMTSGLAGIADSFGKIAVPIRRVAVVGLPPALEGFKIAQLSDSHLGYYVNLNDLEEAVEKIQPQNPDLVLVTGDISDDIKILPDALGIIGRLNPKYGIYASVGNHEYYRGIQAVLRAFEKSPFPILINDHVNIDVGPTEIYLGGADDPRTLRKDYTQFLQNTIDITMRETSARTFKILMSHRPEGLNYSSVMAINLVLSGHTHGGQIGFCGRSLLEPIFPEKYLWGIYRKANTTLHTSGGMGHWIPFRLGVPAEAPILILEKA